MNESPFAGPASYAEVTFDLRYYSIAYERHLPILKRIPSRLGHNGNMSDAPALVFTDWAKKYGDVFTVYFGPTRAVVLNGYAAIHEALVKNAENFSSRPPSLASLSQDGKTLGIANEPYGPKWKEHRKFTLMSLPDFGVGKRSLEGKILEEARALGDEICKTENRAFCISHMMQNAVSNVICSIVFGRRYEYDDEE
ncbi:cytochrome P450 2F3-like [Branchiostoma floridae x Branchiostoma japonicum]